MKTYRSEISAVVHDMAEDLHKSGIIDKVAMQEFDKSCLVPNPQLASAVKHHKGLDKQPATSRHI
ncbi:hypothetical protein RsTz2092_08100 [Deferribacterales bacterium RsTz2092]|nr:hypothetical protein AGMMS49941_08720 [Deferribacterales bacterium]